MIKADYQIEIITDIGPLYVSGYYQNKYIVKVTLDDDIKNAMFFDGGDWFSLDANDDNSKDFYKRPANYIPSATVYNILKKNRHYSSHRLLFYNGQHEFIKYKNVGKHPKNYKGFDGKRIEITYIGKAKLIEQTDVKMSNKINTNNLIGIEKSGVKASESDKKELIGMFKWALRTFFKNHENVTEPISNINGCLKSAYTELIESEELKSFSGEEIKEQRFNKILSFIPEIMEQEENKQTNKRTTRKLSEDTKIKISNAMKGKKKTEEHKQHIKEGMTEYWKTVPYE